MRMLDNKSLPKILINNENNSKYIVENCVLRGSSTTSISVRGINNAAAEICSIKIADPDS